MKERIDKLLEDFMKLDVNQKREVLDTLELAIDAVKLRDIPVFYDDDIEQRR